MKNVPKTVGEFWPVAAIALLPLAGCAQASREPTPPPQPTTISVPFVPSELAYPDNDQALHQSLAHDCEIIVEDARRLHQPILPLCVPMNGKGDDGKGGANNEWWYNASMRWGPDGPPHDPRITLRPMDPPPKGPNQRLLNDCSVKQQTGQPLPGFCGTLQTDDGVNPFRRQQGPAASVSVTAPVPPASAGNQSIPAAAMPTPRWSWVECSMPSGAIVHSPTREACLEYDGAKIVGPTP